MKIALIRTLSGLKPAYDSDNENLKKKKYMKTLNHFEAVGIETEVYKIMAMSVREVVCGYDSFGVNISPDTLTYEGKWIRGFGLTESNDLLMQTTTMREDKIVYFWYDYSNREWVKLTDKTIFKELLCQAKTKSQG